MKRMSMWFAVLGAALAFGVAHAQPYPNKSIRIVVGPGADFIE